MLNELRVLRCVRHPNVVLFFGAYISAHNHDVGLVFERIEGESLDRCVESLSRPSTKLRIALNLSCALRYLHSHTPAIVHGDIKTANVLTQGRGDSIIVKLADFGLSRLVSVTTRVLGGSLRWLAPEVIRSSYSGRPTRSCPVTCRSSRRRAPSARPVSLQTRRRGRRYILSTRNWRRGPNLSEPPPAVSSPFERILVLTIV
eukprot:TRINITY_DN7221_c0_g1_i1.p1 TRINITY_DN7221_c0_g1~~TRINITY_DN7221_c0_g1_i1.p1  ORF type:complete len:202 (+),score=13.64 TRINITY_DN7221_c0_g1_i1:1-606(+)